MTRLELATLVFISLLVAFVVTMAMPVKAGECTMVSASWYGIESCRPHKHCQTATGLPFNGKQWLVAHKTLSFGVRVKFTYRGRTIVAPVGDRGPYVKGRDFDLSRVVAEKLGIVAAGVAKVCAEVLE